MGMTTPSYITLETYPQVLLGRTECIGIITLAALNRDNYGAACHEAIDIYMKAVLQSLGGDWSLFYKKLDDTGRKATVYQFSQKKDESKFEAIFSPGGDYDQNIILNIWNKTTGHLILSTYFIPEEIDALDIIDYSKE